MVTNEHQFRVIYGDTDMMGIVYYANYLRFFEAGRTELLRKLNISYRAFEDAGFVMPVVEANVRYRATATYDDLLNLQTTIAQVRASSLTIEYRLTRESNAAMAGPDVRSAQAGMAGPDVRPAPTSTLICTGETRHACLAKSGRIVRWPAMIKEKLNGS